MPDENTRIAAKVRGIASEHSKTQEQIADLLGLSRYSVNLRFQGKVAFTGPELLRLSDALCVNVEKFFPEHASRRMPEAVAS